MNKIYIVDYLDRTNCEIINLLEELTSLSSEIVLVNIGGKHENCELLNNYVLDVINSDMRILHENLPIIYMNGKNYKKYARDIHVLFKDRLIKLFWPQAFYITESEVFRNNKDNYFTFSPFQDTQEFFINLNKGVSIKKQLCIRYINKLDLTNPLAMNVHNCYSYQRYDYNNHSENIINVINKLSCEYNINHDNVVVKIPRCCTEYLTSLTKEYKYEICDDKNCIATLGIPGDHYYVKVAYSHKNGLIPFANFVLVDLHNNVSKLDSIFYQDRLELIFENETYIMNLSRYRMLVNTVKEGQPFLSDMDLHEIINHYISIVILFSLGVTVNNKGIGNELKRKIKAFIIFVKYYTNGFDPFRNIIEISECIENLYNIKCDIDKMLSEFEACYYKIEKELERNIDRLPKLYAKYGKEELTASFGIPKEEFGYRKKCTTDNYPFV